MIWKPAEGPSAIGLALAPLGPHDVDEASALLGRAFRDNPLTRAVVGGRDGTRLRSTRRGMALQMRQFLEHGEVVGAHADGRLVGVRMTVPPGLWPLPASPWPARLWLALRQGRRISGRWAEVGEQLEARHPIAGHAYLSILGVDPPSQGRGVGRALLQDWVRELDAREAWAWLETDQEHCLAFYGSAGFERKERLELFGAALHLMERPRIGRSRVAKRP